MKKSHRDAPFMFCHRITYYKLRIASSRVGLKCDSMTEHNDGQVLVIETKDQTFTNGLDQKGNWSLLTIKLCRNSLLNC